MTNINKQEINKQEITNCGNNYTTNQKGVINSNNTDSSNEKREEGDKGFFSRIFTFFSSLFFWA